MGLILAQLHVILFTSALFSLMAVSRKIISNSFFRRPLIGGLIWWLITGEATPALPLAIFFELLWLDLFYVGTYIPPLGIFPLLSILVSFWPFVSTPPSLGQLMPAVIVCLPLAHLGTLIETKQRVRDMHYYDKINSAAVDLERLETVSKKAIFNSIFQTFTMYFMAFFVCTYLVSLVVALYHSLYADWNIKQPNLEWPFLWMLATIGGILALRIRWAIVTFSAGVILLGCFVLLWQ